MSRLAASLLAALALAFLIAPASSAQEQGPVRLTLVKQTPWNSPKQPKLEVVVRAENSGDATLDQLALGITLWAPVTSRSEYELSLASDPIPAVQIHGEVRPQAGTLSPGTVRTFGFVLDLTSFPGLDPAQSLIYPLKVDLRSRGVPAAALRTPVVFLVKVPETPLRLSWTFVLHEPVLFGPDERFRTAALEESLAQGGRLVGEIRALQALSQSPDAKPVDVVISPTLLLQLALMRAGYSVVAGGQTRHVPAGKGGSAAAAAALAGLKQIVSSGQVEVSAFPFSAARLPSLIAAGLSRDVPLQLQRGRDEVSALLGASPIPSVLRPPDSSLDEASLSELARLGVGVLLLDPAAVPPLPQPLGFAAPPTASLLTGGAPVSAVVPDQGTQALLSSPVVESDPVLAAQAVLGELAAVWLERPGVDRGLAMAFSEDQAFPGAFFGPLVRRIAGAPWLRPVSATSLAAEFPPPDEPGRLVPLYGGTFGRTYVESLREARQLIDTYRSMLVSPSSMPDRLETTLFLAESGEFVDLPNLGLELIGWVRDTLGAEFAKVHADTGQPVTLTSSTGTIPVRVTNDTGQPLKVTVELVSPHLRFTRGASQGPLDLTGPDEVLNFEVQIRTTGRFPVQVLVKSPSGRVLSQSTLIVRSTAFNRVALLITIGSAVVLLALWGRRFIPRRRS